MQIEILNVINHSSIYQIKKDGVDIYNAQKHRIPCWSCLVGPSCFNEKKATNRAKYLRYTIKFEKPCINCILAMDLINLAISGLLITPLHEIEEIKTSELSKQIFELTDAIEKYEIDGEKFGPEAYAKCISLIHRDPDEYEGDFAYAYYCLGDIFYFSYQEIEHAIELYSASIDYDNKNPHVLVARGQCFYHVGDYINALNDFKKTAELDGGLYDLCEEIEECENLARYMRPPTI